MIRVTSNSGFARLRPIAGACLLGATAACASFNGTPRGAETPTGTVSQGHFHLQGTPPALASRANALLNTGDPAPRSVLEKRNRAQALARSVEDLLASEGYLAAEVRPEDMTTLESSSVLTVDPGPRFTVASVRLAGADALDADTRKLVDGHLAELPVGSPVRTANVEQIEAELITTLQARGFAFASSPGIDALASREDANVEITYTIDTGPLVRLGDLVSDETDPRSQKAIQVLKTWREGATYNPRTIDRLRGRLRSSGLYEGIGVVVSDQPDADGYHTVSLTLAEADPRSVSFGVTASTTEGVGADALWERRNVTGRADKVSVLVEAATLARSVTVGYERPNIGRFGRTLLTEVGVRQEETQAYDLDGAKIGATLAQPFSRQLTLSVGAEIDATRITDQRTRIYLGEREQVTFSIPVTATYTDVRDPLDPQEGIRAFAAVENGISLGESTPGYTRMQISGATYRKIADDLVAAVRAEYGAFSGSNSVPTDRLFFAGGGGTVRGYEYQSLSPTDEFGEFLGGRSLFSASAELRWRRSERFGYAAFVDIGAASDDVGSVFGESKASAGLGIRYYPGFGPIRFDIAAPLNKRDGDAPLQIYVSIGQAF
ncbi:outer membrane protein, OMP85 family [Hyphomonas neptunium ATCC 15444]|uniref:Outer membrane protein, OMP85 family n=2 Tax=Hyphomonas TaxID=85 RepID=Q0C135_HYPNA|nr:MULTISPECIES: BamA/TamA family outer membrane protein [Hyphomonas]ABI77274.1 outer membrane protein, OMP85 family [Hyphomonas neptunium ATCC 15444]KCZ95027.1 OMP85 family outer membrane protein [Hyphomonas hirschiana VP5]